MIMGHTAVVADDQGTAESGEDNTPSKLHHSKSHWNVGTSERWLSTVAGGAIALYGLKRGRLTGAALTAVGFGLIRRGYTGHCSLYSALAVNTADQQPAKPEAYFERGVHVEESVTIQKEPAELYKFWRQLDNLPRFMAYLKSVTVHDDKHSHWVAKSPVGINVQWDAEVINDEPASLIAWRSLGGGSIDIAGSVRFCAGPEGRGTEVRVTLDYIPPAGKLGAAVAKVLGPDSEVRDDLRHFKMIMETGEIATIDGQSRGD